MCLHLLKGLAQYVLSLGTYQLLPTTNSLIFLQEAVLGTVRIAWKDIISHIIRIFPTGLIFLY